jgi:hypothetical protein
VAQVAFLLVVGRLVVILFLTLLLQLVAAVVAVAVRKQLGRQVAVVVVRMVPVQPLALVHPIKALQAERVALMARLLLLVEVAVALDRSAEHRSLLDWVAWAVTVCKWRLLVQVFTMQVVAVQVHNLSLTHHPLVVVVVVVQVVGLQHYHLLLVQPTQVAVVVVQGHFKLETMA